jgi:hypothetical protein
MVCRLDWIPANVDDNSDPQMFKAISELIKNLEPQDCPVCMNEKIRFYYTVSNFQPDFVTKKRHVRGTIWVWCPSCLHWTHGSGINLPKNVTYINKLDESELKQAKGTYMIDNLNRFWEKERLSKSFLVTNER